MSILYLIIFFILGSLMGSFYTVLGLRIPKKEDFITSMQTSGLNNKVIENIFAKFIKSKDKWFEFIDISFLPGYMKDCFKVLIAEKLEMIQSN